VSLLTSFLPSIAPKVQGWIEEQRAKHIGGACVLTDAEHERLAGYFPDAALVAARLKTVRRIENPPFLEGLLKQAAFFEIRVQFDFNGVSGITFVDCILVKEKAPSADLLFHEMVHVEQYRQLGTEGFVQAYVRGMVDGGLVYERIPLEAIASEMTARFAAGEKFNVADELAAWLRARGYLQDDNTGRQGKC